MDDVLYKLPKGCIFSLGCSRCILAVQTRQGKQLSKNNLDTLWQESLFHTAIAIWGLGATRDVPENHEMLNGPSGVELTVMIYWSFAWEIQRSPPGTTILSSSSSSSTIHFASYGHPDWAILDSGP